MTDWIWIHYARARPHWYELPAAERAAKLAAWTIVCEESQASGGSAFKNGTIAALIAQNPKQEGEIAMDVAAKIIAGQHVDPTVYSDIAVIHSGETTKADRFEYKADCSL